MKNYTYKGFQIEVITNAKKSISDLKAILKLINRYDHNYSHIDDYTQYKKALQNNVAIRIALSTLKVKGYTYFDHVVLCDA